MTQRKNILIVDDDADLCRTWKSILGERGYNVKTIRYGYIALIELKNHDYDLIFMDIKLIGLDGVEVYKELKKVKPEAKVVIITGYNSDEINTRMEEGIKCGMIDELLRKPIEPEKVIEIIEKYAKG